MDGPSGHDEVPQPPPTNHHHNQEDMGNSKEEDESRAANLAALPSFLENLIREGHFTHQPHRSSTHDIDRYFVGPRDLDKHTKWPVFLRLHGSVLPKMLVPLSFVAAWSTLITCISVFVHPLGVNNILLTVLGFVVGLALSFRNSTAYERYGDGRKYWAMLLQSSRIISRTVWVSISEREGENGKTDLLAKVSALNLLVAFAIALKHKLRFEPHVAYEDLVPIAGYLDTFAKNAHDPELLKVPKKSTLKAAGEYLGVPFAESNPRKLIKRSKKPLGNLPLEILNHLAAYIDMCVNNGTLSSAIHLSQVLAALNTLSEVLTGTERVLGTPLPAAYRIAISQIAWVYVLVLPFQLYTLLKWITIPGTIVAAYIILGLAAIGEEIENPFGHDVNDLPLDNYCMQLASELDIIAAAPPPKAEEFLARSDNLVLYPLSFGGFSDWKERSIEDIRAALKTKVIANSSQTPGLSKASSMVDLSFSSRVPKNVV